VLPQGRSGAVPLQRPRHALLLYARRPGPPRLRLARALRRRHGAPGGGAARHRPAQRHGGRRPRHRHAGRDGHAHVARRRRARLHRLRLQVPPAAPAVSDERAERVLDASEAAALVRDGMVVGLSGFSHQNPPMARVREIIRRRVKGLTIVSGPTSGIETDLLIGAGCVRRAVTAGVAFEQVVPMAPAFRRAAERGEIEVWECDECLWHLALKAAAWGMPYLLWRGGVGTSIPELNPDLEEVQEGGRRYLKVPARPLDIVFLHAAEADRFGNVRAARQAYLGRSFCERALALACRGPVVASVERLVPDDETLGSPERTLVRGAFVVEAPWGAHPGGTSGRYAPDLEHYAEYAAAGEARRKGDPQPYQRYLERHVYGPEDHDGYLRTIGAGRLEALR